MMRTNAKATSIKNNNYSCSCRTCFRTFCSNSCRTCLTNRIRSISHLIKPLVNDNNYSCSCRTCFRTFCSNSCRTCLTNRIRSISCHIKPLVINCLGHGNTHTHACMHTNNPHRIDFKKPGARRSQNRHAYQIH